MRQGSKIGARAAERLLRGGDPAGEQERAVAAVLAALDPEQEPREAPDELVAAFTASRTADRQVVGHARRRSGARSRSIGRATVAKAAIVLTLASGATFVAAAADALPGPAQQVVHRLFGSWGVPAPHGTVSSTPSPSTGGGGPSPSPYATATYPGQPSKASASPSSVVDCTATHGHEANARCGAASTDGRNSPPGGASAAPPAGASVAPPAGGATDAHPSPGSGNGHEPSSHPGPSLSPADLHR